MNRSTLICLSNISRSTCRLFRMRAMYQKLLNRDVDPTIQLPVKMGDVNLPMELHLRDHVDFELFYHGTFEEDEGKVLGSILKPGDVMLDLGANIGYYTLFAANRVGETGEVHSFEPTPTTFARLATNVRINNLNNVHLNNCAVSDRKGTIEMHICPGNSGGNSFAKQESGNRSVSVPMVSVDEYVKGKGVEKITLIKMDVEGAEVLALRGMRELITRFRPHFLIEVNALCLSRLDFSIDDLVNTMTEYGYSLTDIHTGKPFVMLPHLDRFKTDVHAFPI